jgi:hypothetical protein
MVDGSSATPHWPSTPADDILALQQQHQLSSSGAAGMSSQLAALKRELKVKQHTSPSIAVQHSCLCKVTFLCLQNVSGYVTVWVITISHHF